MARRVSKGMWAVYMVRCSRGALYSGMAKDVDARIRKHNSGKGSRAVIALGLPVRLAYVKEVPSKSEALRFEARLKRLSKADKERLAGEWMRRSDLQG